MKIRGIFTIKKISADICENAPFTLSLTDPSEQCQLKVTFDQQTACYFDIPLTLKLAGTRLFGAIENKHISDENNNPFKIADVLGPHDVILKHVKRIEKTKFNLPGIEPKITHHCLKFARFETFTSPSRLSLMPCPFYELEVPLEDSEFEDLSQKNAPTVYTVTFSLFR